MKDTDMVKAIISDLELDCDATHLVGSYFHCRR